MKRGSLYTIIFFFLAVIIGVGYYRQQHRIRQILNQNERLLNENRDLKQSLSTASGAAQQIADRKDQQERVQGQFVERRTYYRRNWQQFISVSTSDYRTGLLGGIKNLQVIVRNQTEYPIDNVVVTVQYLRSKGDVFKSEQYTVNDVPGKGTRSIEASGSRKGMKVELKLVSITSQAMNFCWSADKRVAQGDPDPFLCTK
ncbi:hypothetical protein F0L74_31330 [Chitinophaga agrisoli]|uniref:Uncharacterized protein n=1 Tax=Chitinophaga agrisoli TaxID=2607653 RepID=A0A5B2VM49_9BACT|nr:hypothetical protein [Chitinophaga agrisoli]KAA2240643.1 hypothetical protein F0L74_31330 [Chitinophaga agrisoli]